MAVMDEVLCQEMILSARKFLKTSNCVNDISGGGKVTEEGVYFYDKFGQFSVFVEESQICQALEELKS